MLNLATLAVFTGFDFRVKNANVRQIQGGVSGHVPNAQAGISSFCTISGSKWDSRLHGNEKFGASSIASGHVSYAVERKMTMPVGGNEVVDGVEYMFQIGKFFYCTMVIPRISPFCLEFQLGKTGDEAKKKHPQGMSLRCR
ncbi:MAG: hypothetical protein V4724_20345 [Pseudomonadota bacterium]